MKVAVMGAGAVGCYYGGMLARAGHAVVLIGRQSHVAAINRRGLDLETQSFRETVAVRASTDPAAVAGAELVLCSVKSTDTQSAAEAMAPHLAPDTLVLSLQNGVDNAERLAARLPQRVAPAVVYVAADMGGPGHVRHHGRGELVVEPGLFDPARRQAFAAAGIPLEESTNVAGALWAKLVLNCAYNALSALTQQPYGVLWPFPGVQAVMSDAVNECLAVATAEGVTLPASCWEAVARIAATMPGQKSSTAQDLARGKPSEIDYLNGFILRRGEALGIPTPVNRVLHTLVKLREAYPEASVQPD